MRADLHIHSTASDGTLDPRRVVRAALEGGLDVIALTDHDTVAGLDDAVDEGKTLGIEVVRGIELSTTQDGVDLHVLGYFVESSPPLLEHTRKAEQARRSRMREMVGRLARLGAAVTFDDVVRAAGGEGSILARPHLAAALVEAGHARTVRDAFDRYIADGRPGFVPTSIVDVADGIEVLTRAGGVPVWAHPDPRLVERLLPALVEAGLQGVEAYRPSSDRRATRGLDAEADALGLLTSGGSDWHGPDRNPPLGTFWVDESQVGALLERGGRGAG